MNIARSVILSAQLIVAELRVLRMRHIKCLTKSFICILLFSLFIGRTSGTRTVCLGLSHRVHLHLRKRCPRQNRKYFHRAKCLDSNSFQGFTGSLKRIGENFKSKVTGTSVHKVDDYVKQFSYHESPTDGRSLRVLFNEVLINELLHTAGFSLVGEENVRQY